VSQTRDSEADDETPQYRRAHTALGRMMATGRSFSGRERNAFFLNTGDGRFANVSSGSGLDLIDDGRALAVTDWDQDGDLDVWISNRTAPQLRLMRNDSPATNRFIELRLRGDGATGNRDGVGARVEVLPADGDARRLVKTLRAGEGFLTQSSKWMHFGLGGRDGPVAVLVRWPGGGEQRFDSLEVDRRYELVQGAAGARELPARRGELTIRAQAGPRLAPTTPARAAMGMLLPMPPLAYARFDGRADVARPGDGRTLLIDLWASWCPPCVAELTELGARHDELRAAGVDVVALSVDGLGDDRSDGSAAADLARRLELPFVAARATPATMELLQTMHDAQFVLDLSLPVPTSLLVDDSGRLALIYKGKVSVDELLREAAAASSANADRWPRAAGLPGSLIDDHRLVAAESRAELPLRLQLAGFLHGKGFGDTALQHLRAAVESSPDSAEAHKRLGSLLATNGRLDEARSELERAAELRPGDAGIHNNLGSVLASLGKYRDAVRHYEEALRLDPTLVDAQRNLARARPLVGDPE